MQQGGCRAGCGSTWGQAMWHQRCGLLAWPSLPCSPGCQPLAPLLNLGHLRQWAERPWAAVTSSASGARCWNMLYPIHRYSPQPVQALASPTHCAWFSAGVDMHAVSVAGLHFAHCRLTAMLSAAQPDPRLTPQTQQEGCAWAFSDIAAQRLYWSSRAHSGSPSTWAVLKVWSETVLSLMPA